MAKLTGFMFQDDYLERLAKLSDQEVGRLVRALAKYHVTGETQELAGRESIAYDFIKADIDRIDQRYKEKCETNSNNRQRPSTTDNDRQRPSTTVNDCQQPSTTAHKVKEKEKEKDKENNNDKEKVQRENRRFAPPTREEVAAYIAEKGFAVDPDRWMAYYESNGWRVGKNPMKDWKAAIRTWATNDLDSRPQQQRPRTVAAQQYTQREYQKDDNDGFDWLREMVAKEGSA